jgi:hypothetical protein
MSTHRANVTALVGASLASGNWIPVNGDSLKGQLFLTTMEGAEGYSPVTKGVKEPLLPDSP